MQGRGSQVAAIFRQLLEIGGGEGKGGWRHDPAKLFVFRKLVLEKKEAVQN
jgi:hypothetical protein